MCYEKKVQNKLQIQEHEVLHAGVSKSFLHRHLCTYEALNLLRTQKWKAIEVSMKEFLKFIQEITIDIRVAIMPLFHILQRWSSYCFKNMCDSHFANMANSGLPV